MLKSWTPTLVHPKNSGGIIDSTFTTARLRTHSWKNRPQAQANIFCPSRFHFCAFTAPAVPTRILSLLVCQDTLRIDAFSEEFKRFIWWRTCRLCPHICERKQHVHGNAEYISQLRPRNELTPSLSKAAVGQTVHKHRYIHTLSGALDAIFSLAQRKHDNCSYLSNIPPFLVTLAKKKKL